jgi:hypothetical protein
MKDSSGLGVQHFYPVAIRVTDECETLHRAGIWLFLEGHTQLLEALASCIHIRHLRSTAVATLLRHLTATKAVGKAAQSFTCHRHIDVYKMNVSQTVVQRCSWVTEGFSAVSTTCKAAVQSSKRTSCIAGSGCGCGHFISALLSYCDCATSTSL